MANAYPAVPIRSSWISDREGCEVTRMDFQNGRDVKQAAASKLRGMGHKLVSKCKFQDVLDLVELEMGRPGRDNPIRLMLDFLEDANPARVAGSQINLMERPALKFSRQMQIAAERAQVQPRVPSMASSIPEYANRDWDLIS